MSNESSHCMCRGGHCEHHDAFQPCPNEVIESVSVTEIQAGTWFTNRAAGICEECWQNAQEYDLAA